MPRQLPLLRKGRRPFKGGDRWGTQRGKAQTSKRHRELTREVFNGICTALMEIVFHTPLVADLVQSGVVYVSCRCGDMYVCVCVQVAHMLWSEWEDQEYKERAGGGRTEGERGGPLEAGGREDRGLHH